MAPSRLWGEEKRTATKMSLVAMTVQSKELEGWPEVMHEFWPSESKITALTKPLVATEEKGEASGVGGPAGSQSLSQPTSTISASLGMISKSYAK